MASPSSLPSPSLASLASGRPQKAHGLHSERPVRRRWWERRVPLVPRQAARPPSLPSPRRALPAAAAGHSGTAHLQTHSVPAVQAVSMPGRPASPRGDGGGCPRPRWWGAKSPSSHPGCTGQCSSHLSFLRVWPDLELRPDPVWRWFSLLHVTGSHGDPRYSTVRCWAPTRSHPQAVLGKPLGAVPGRSSGSCRWHSHIRGSPTPHGAAPHLLAPTLPHPLHPPAGLLLPRPWLLLDTGPFPQRLLCEASSDYSSRITWPRWTWMGGVLPGPGGQGSLPEARPYSTHQDPLPGQKVGVGYVCLGPPDPGWQNEDLIQALLGP